MFHRLTILLSILLFSVACAGGGNGGGDSGGGDTTTSDTVGGGEITPVTLTGNKITKQEGIPESEWNKVVPQHQDLGMFKTQFAADGYKLFHSGGILEDDQNNVLHWASYVLEDGSARRFMAHTCAGNGECKAATIKFKNGDAVFKNGEGEIIDPILIVRPSMSKELEGFDHDGKTTISSALNAESQVEVPLGRRRLVIANAFGKAYSVDLSSLESMATATNAFSEINTHNYADAAVVEDALLTSTPFDVLVWVGASIREKMSGGAHKTIGMTVNNGVYGDSTFKASTVRELLSEAPFGGPGLVVLVGNESRGDGSKEQDANLSLFKEFTDSQTRIVVGFLQSGEANDLLDAANRFTADFMNGMTLAAARDSANALLEERGSPALLATNRSSQAEEITFKPSLDSLWDGNDPKQVIATINFNIANICFPENGGPAYSEKEGQASFFVKVDFDGPFFSGSRVASDINLDVTMEGIMLGNKPGDHILLRFSGNLKPSVSDVAVIGVGVILDTFDEDNPTRIFFNGTADASDYINDKGETCKLKSPTLTGATSQPSWLQFPKPGEEGTDGGTDGGTDSSSETGSGTGSETGSGTGSETGSGTGSQPPPPPPAKQ
jgi:hypothetical protein